MRDDNGGAYVIFLSAPPGEPLHHPPCILSVHVIVILSCPGDREVKYVSMHI